jgi:hypothetical protein
MSVLEPFSVCTRRDPAVTEVRYTAREPTVSAPDMSRAAQLSMKCLRSVRGDVYGFCLGSTASLYTREKIMF